MIRTSLDGAIIADIVATLSYSDTRPRTVGRQPVHTCYVPADKVTPELPREWGAAALAALDEHRLLLDVPEPILTKVREKLAREPVEDLRIDFEDGYGTRRYDVEDTDAVRAATLIADWHRTGTGPPWSGIRFKSFDTTALLERGVRTLDIFLTTLASATPAARPAPSTVADPADPGDPTDPTIPPSPTAPLVHIYDKYESGGGDRIPNAGGARVPDGMGMSAVRLTFPKVTAPEQVSALCDLLEVIEDRLGVPEGALRFEIQIETAQSIVDSSGRAAVPRLIAAGRGRVSGLHFGTYDYTAACGLDAAQQQLAHPACDFARHIMQVSAAGTGVRLADGSSNILPVGDAVERGWRTHYALVRRSLEHGFHQGWDLHPAQLVTRYAAVYAYYLATAPESARRLGAYLSGATGSVADEPATARALAGTLRRAVDCGALTEAEVAELVGTSDWATAEPAI